MKEVSKDKHFEILRTDKRLLEILLLDNSTNSNLLWATDYYNLNDSDYLPNQNIPIDAVFAKKLSIIKPRILKTKKEQDSRSKNSAEVFTPSWVCNNQNNLLDEVWFGQKSVFNIENECKWEVNCERVKFPVNKSWISYIKEKRLEITCGEAPYIVSRYDSVSGEYIEPYNRVGILDRKIRIINENTSNEKDWLEYIYLAYKSVYGFDWQGDNVFIARENLLISFIEYYEERFKKKPIDDYIYQIAKIISWNIWQMDGLKFVVPNSCQVNSKIEINLFGEETISKVGCNGCINEDLYKHNGIYCKVMDWDKKLELNFVETLYKGGN